MSEVGMPASALLRGLASMPRKRSEIKAGDVVRVRLAVRGGWLWESARVSYAYPRADFERRFDVVLRDGRVLRSVCELSLRSAT